MIFRKRGKMPKIMQATARMLWGRSLATIAAGGVSLGLVSLPGAALADDTQLAWQGIATTTGSTTAQCQGALGSAPGDTQVSVFRPKIKSTDSATFLSFVFLRAAETWEDTSKATAHQMHGSGKYEGYGVNRRAEFYDFGGTFNLTVSPAAVIASTPVVTITGTITNYGNNAGCDVTFKGVYAPLID
jgi:hypothetical protein